MCRVRKNLRKKRPMTLTKNDLLPIFQKGCKEANTRGIGIEREHFLYDRRTLKRLNYPQIAKVLQEFLKLGWEGIFEQKNIVGAKKDGTSLSIEPGGQFELSGKIHKNLHEAREEIDLFENDLEKILQHLHFFKIDMGFEPLWMQKDLTWMPKGRYDIMRYYMPTKGRLGHDMMRRTCTLQVNLDYTDKENMGTMMRVAQALHPLVAGAFANSPFVKGELSGYQSFRNHVWAKTDPDRCGLLPFVHTSSMGFERYLDYLLDVPMYFIKREGAYINAAGRSFRHFMEGNLQDIYEGEATLSDFYEHMTTAFPEVRLKTFVEIRGIDSSKHAFSAAALYTGLLYDEHTLNAISTLTQTWSFGEIEQLYHDVPRDGLGPHTIAGRPLWEVMQEVYECALHGLQRRALGEEVYLAPLRKIIHDKRTQSDILMEEFTHHNNSVGFLFPV